MRKPKIHLQWTHTRTGSWLVGGRKMGSPSWSSGDTGSLVMEGTEILRQALVSLHAVTLTPLKRSQVGVK